MAVSVFVFQVRFKGKTGSKLANHLLDATKNRQELWFEEPEGRLWSRKTPSIRPGVFKLGEMVLYNHFLTRLASAAFR